MKIGLRIDVDTFRGTRLGVPNLCRLLAASSIKASFFFSVGPDNMGRHLWRLLKPTFLWKMLRTKAASLYGWDILLRGTFWPGPIIGEKLGSVIRSAFDTGHEIGLHAYDHHAWQARIDTMDDDNIYRELKKGYDLLEKILGKPPTCSAAPGWKCNDMVLLAKNRFPFDYNSDCRGKSIFRPITGSGELFQPQVPVTLPTYDEVVGRNDVDDNNYNDYMLSLLEPAKLNVLTIHAEVEGIACLEMFEQFVKSAISKGFVFVPLKVLFEEYPQSEPAAIVEKEIPGRHGWVCCQSD
jgi:undecaprenyl phosphate-alpha-L-ara4FN deformylase